MTDKAPLDVEALARETVEAMGDVFYDADPDVDSYGPDELHVQVVACVQAALEEAVSAAALPCTVCGLDQRAEHGLCQEHYQAACRSIQYRPRLRSPGPHIDFQVIAGEQVLASLRVRPRRAPGSTRRTPSNRAVEVTFPTAGDHRRLLGLEAAARYLKRLGIPPAPLWQRALEKGWEADSV